MVLASELRDAAASALAWTDVEVLATVRGAGLEHLRLQHPFNDYDVPVILGEHVTTETGTGAVHTAPGHGQEDFDVGRRYDLAVVNPVDSRGLFVEGTPVVGGERLESERTAARHCCANAVPCSTTSPSSTATRTAGATRRRRPSGPRRSGSSRWTRPACATRHWRPSNRSRWVPEWGEARIKGMVEGRPDWCISRQRTWGVPLGLFIDRETQEPHPDSAEILARSPTWSNRKASTCWYEDDIAERLGVDGESL
jgi:isoleucyl-tRNA synthetase